MKRLVLAIRRRYRPRRIILFGSAAQKGRKRIHDLDLLIIKATRASHAKRSEDIYRAMTGVRCGYPVDAIVYTPAEFQERFALGDPFLRRIVLDGQILYDAAA
ncbi:MAG: hypothetical protein A3C53_00935 [Omnitrophica WOR_2 bacterium RIFCSPHIGHO2_02_FULL_68_15]|nr:MAG: hypothetical protein A3C53_00935 [Omnitrophica WOR_2 bacterium RIFCSPHIGHO2_02_FULL_68_15]